MSITLGTATLIGGLASAGATAATSIGGAMRSLKKNKELAKYQQELSMQNWLTQQAYNHPEAQLQRLQEAGLNPHLAYGSGSLQGNTAPQAPETPDVQPVDLQDSYSRIGQSISSGINAVIQSRQINQDIKQSNAQIEAIYDSLKTSYLQRLELIQNMKNSEDENTRKWLQLDQQERELLKNIEYIDAKIDEARNHIDIENRQSDRDDAYLLLAEKKQEKEIERISQEIGESEARTSVAWKTASKIQKEVDNYDEYVKQVQSSTELNNEQARKICLESVVSEAIAIHTAETGTPPTTGMASLVDKLEHYIRFGGSRRSPDDAIRYVRGLLEKTES